MLATEYEETWRLIPSNILRALTKSKKQSIVQKYEKLPIEKFDCKIEIEITSNFKFWSINNKIKVAIIKKINFIFGPIFFLSSIKPIRKKIVEPYMRVE